MKHLDLYIFVAVAVAVLALQSPWAAVLLYITYSTKLEVQAFFKAKQVKFSDEQLAKLDWLEKEVKQLNQIQNLKNKF
jgi:hypothetical protein